MKSQNIYLVFIYYYFIICISTIYQENIFVLSQVTATTTETYTSTTPLPPPNPGTRAYNIIIGIDENIGAPENEEAYVNSLLAIIGNFSARMYETTNKRFYIKSVELVIPNSWSITANATENSFQTAHIRVSNRIDTPRSENPNICGQSGNYIEVPATFFENSNETYGSPDKALLNLWARYRWGVWEEHGYPGSLRFPYFYEGEDTWEPVGCSNDEINGEYLNTGSTNETCDNDGEYPPGPDCRFHPFENNTATSSLMYLSSLETVTEFCTDSNHNKEAPNKQNMFCQHQSTWDIIESCSDFMHGDDLVESLPELETKITKRSQRPMFYLLLDRGRSIIPPDAFENIKRNISRLFEGGAIPVGIVAAIGMFPRIAVPESHDSSSIVQELVPWTITTANNSEFNLALEDFVLDGPTNRDFGLALYETINKIKILKHEPGTILLIFKTGAGSNFDEIHYEREIIAAAKEARIMIHSIEIRRTQALPNINLVKLVQEVNGMHMQLNTISQISSIQATMVSNIVRQLRNPLSNTGNHRVIFKQFLQSNEETSFQIFPTYLSSIQISFTTTYEIHSLTIIYNDEEIVLANPELEWSESGGLAKRYIYNTTIEFNNTVENDAELTFKFTCRSGHTGECKGFLVILGTHNHARASPYNIQVSTSIPRDIKYYDTNNDNEATINGPIHIFAKIERNRRPMRRLDSVKATIYTLKKSWTIELFDNGFGVPDIYENDGVYSGYFIPSIGDKNFRVFILIEQSLTEEATTGTQRNRYSALSNFHHHSGDNKSNKTRLLPVDQLNPGCSIGQCNAIKPVENFTFVADLTYSFVVGKYSDWTSQNIPSRIVDLKAWAGTDFFIHLYWTSPPVYALTNDEITEQTPVDAYEIYISYDIESLLNELDGTKITVDESNEVGEAESWSGQFNNSTGGSETYFIGIRGWFEGIEGPISNIVKITTRENELPTTTPEPTTTTEEPTTPEPTTIPTTTEPIVTRPTTTTRRPTPSTVSTTTQETEDSKSWIEKPEGYLVVAGFGLGVIIICVIVAAYLYVRNRSSNKSGGSNNLQQRLFPKQKKDPNVNRGYVFKNNV